MEKLDTDISCFDAAIGSLSATLLDLEESYSSASQSHDALVDGVQQVKNQQQAICFLLSNLTATIPPTPPEDDIQASSQSLEIPCSSSDAGSASEISTGITPGIDDRCWMEPPPEYSPPQQNRATRFIEKACSTTEPHGILARSPELETSSEYDENAILDAVLQNDSRALSYLLDNFADPSVHIGELQRTPLHQAAHLNHCSCITTLLKHGAVMSTEDVKGDTALHLAAWAGHVEALATLLAHGADVDWLSGGDGYSPLWCAISSYQIDAARLLLKHGARVSLRAASGGGLTPLHQAAVTGQSAMCELLLERGAQTDCLDDEKNTPLHHAAACGSAASVKVLLRGGARIEARQVHGLTALHWAAHKGHTEVVSVLLDSGAAIDCQANESGGVTPLHLAANRGHVSAARMLLDRGADGNVVALSWDGMSGTPVELAKARGHIRLMKMLKR
ncbi:hypothetical protein AC578_3584 [Lecanosticta acicola]|uniref:Ankyrin repeat protein n=1 Tax=Lecanosticta acicola TaxID=111012 RepID=A0AAI9EB55_9PEZI|nr:hypothetical protein AC578_3584 [Lecanosticta acicola]